MGGIAKAIISPIGSLLGLSDKKKKKADPVDTTKLINPLLPLSDDANKDAAKRQMLAQQLARAGRSDTILTDSTESLGGGF